MFLGLSTPITYDSASNSLDSSNDSSSPSKSAEAAGNPVNQPGPIDNSPLFNEQDSSDLREHMIDDLDYQMVPQEAWQLLVENFGLTDGQEPIARKVLASVNVGK